MCLDCCNGLHFLNPKRIGDSNLCIYEPYKNLFVNSIEEIEEFNLKIKELSIDDRPKYHTDIG